MAIKTNFLFDNPATQIDTDLSSVSRAFGDGIRDLAKNAAKRIDEQSKLNAAENATNEEALAKMEAQVGTQNDEAVNAYKDLVKNTSGISTAKKRAALREARASATAATAKKKYYGEQLTEYMGQINQDPNFNEAAKTELRKIAMTDPEQMTAFQEELATPEGIRKYYNIEGVANELFNQELDLARKMKAIERTRTEVAGDHQWQVTQSGYEGFVEEDENGNLTPTLPDNLVTSLMANEHTANYFSTQAKQIKQEAIEAQKTGNLTPEQEAVLDMDTEKIIKRLAFAEFAPPSLIKKTTGKLELTPEAKERGLKERARMNVASRERVASGRSNATSERARAWDKTMKEGLAAAKEGNLTLLKTNPVIQKVYPDVEIWKEGDKYLVKHGGTKGYSGRYKKRITETFENEEELREFFAPASSYYQYQGAASETGIPDEDIL